VTRTWSRAVPACGEQAGFEAGPGENGFCGAGRRIARRCCFASFTPCMPEVSEAATRLYSPPACSARASHSGKPALNPIAPRNGCSATADHRSRAYLLALPNRSRRFVTTFCSPRTTSCFQVAIPGSPLPACYFTVPLRFPRSRSAFNSPARFGLPRPGLDLRCRPVFRFHRIAFSRLPDFHSPSGLLHPSRSKRSVRTTAEKLTS
jgi:hypothetical protein